MKPMSAIYYIINNIKKILPVGISICLGVMFFYFIFLAARQFTEFNYATKIKPSEYFSRISSNKGKPEDILQEINSNSTIEKIIPSTADTAICGNCFSGITFSMVELPFISCKISSGFPLLEDILEKYSLGFICVA
jgi:hypothetical protein